MGDTWWSQRFITVLETFGIGSRLQRGKRYARSGQVLSMEVTAGQVKASVQGSRARPYRVFIETSVLSEPEWDGIEDVMASSAVFVARLLADEMPEEIEQAFVDSSATLFPASAHELDSACSCPDWENPCKHIAAVFYLLAEAFDEDPFLIFTWRGRGKAELLDGLRARRRGTVPAERSDSHGLLDLPDLGPFGWPVAHRDRGTVPPPEDSLPLWGDVANVAAIETRPRLAVAPDLVLRQLDSSPLGTKAAPIIEGLRPLYEAITSGAAEMALGEVGER
jgi:uncharacterized Zn finger protein